MPIPTYKDNLAKRAKNLLNSSNITVISGGNIFNDDHEDEDVANISIASLNKELASIQTKAASDDAIEFLPEESPHDLPFEQFKNSIKETAGK
jgi:hypothetical protein